MSKKIAVLIYGQPRFLESGIRWRAAYWDEIKKHSPNLEVDFYYHLWDGIEYSQIVEYSGNEDWAEYNEKKRQAYRFDVPWTTFLNDVPVEPMIIEVHELHKKYGLSAPKFHTDRSEMYRSKMDAMLRDSISLRALKSFQMISEDKTRTIEFVTHIEHQYNIWAGLLASPLYSMGKAYDLYTSMKKENYDIIMLTRTDAVINPYNVAGMLEIINKEKPFNFPWEENFYILEQPEMAYFNKVGVRTEDFTYLFCQKTLDIVFNNWYEKLHDMIMIEGFKKLLCNKLIIQNLVQNHYNTHNIIFEMTRSNLLHECTIHFKRQYGALDEQCLIRSGAETYSPSAENFLLMKENMDRMQSIRMEMRK